MKWIVTGILVSSSFYMVTGCEKSATAAEKAGLSQGDCLKGILVKKGICGQRVVKINSETKVGISYATAWKDESTGKTYENVFTVENVCSFPSAINEGGEFNFKLITAKDGDCIQCQAFTPVPKEKNNITVKGDCSDVKN